MSFLYSLEVKVLQIFVIYEYHIRKTNSSSLCEPYVVKKLLT